MSPRDRSALARAVSAAASHRQVKAPGGDRANREEIESREGREHVLLWWHVTAEEAAAGAEHSGGPAYGEHGYVQVWRANQVGANNRPRGGARPLLEGPAPDPERFRLEIDFLRASLANDETY